MKRIALIVFRCLLILPFWMARVKTYYRNRDSVSLQKRYDFICGVDRRLLKTGRIDVVASGMENLPEEQGYLLTPNHQGFADPLAIFASHQNIYKGVVKKELVNAPLIGKVIKMLEYTPIDRQDNRKAVKTIKSVSKELEAGINYLVFPEGTRSRKGNEINEFKWGTFKMATVAKAPIVPVAIVDSFKVFESNNIKKTTVYLKYLEPIRFEEYQDLKTNELALEVERRVKLGIEELIKLRDGKTSKD